MHHRLLAPLAAACVFAAAAQAAPAPRTAAIGIDNFAFSPAYITIAPGTTVTWSNQDDIPHTVTDASRPRTYKSPPLDTGDSFSHVFAAPGTYHYFCSLHPHMQGTIVVR